MSIDEDTLPPDYRAPFPTFGSNGMAVCDHPLAAQAGRQILQEGGNAVDAAVAISLALGVVCPYYTGIGGGGFMLVWMPGMNAPRLLDYRETAPGAAHAEMFAGESSRGGDAVPPLDKFCGETECRSVIGGLAVGVPGTVRGLARAQQEHGNLSWSQVVQPALALTHSEIEVDVNFSRISWCKRDQIRQRNDAAAVFLRPDGRVPRPGSKVRHPELSWTYERLASEGPEDFYTGEIAARILTAVAEAGGILSAADLAGYEPLWREPLSSEYRGHQVYTVGPPSGGGIQLLQILRVLGNFPPPPGGWSSLAGLHRLAEAMRVSFHERSSRVADPAFSEVPLDWLLDSVRLDQLAARIDAQQVMSLPASPAAAPSVGGTASFVVGCKNGGMVAATESVNLWHGSLVVPQGCGFVLNNVMDDFQCYPGRPDAFGLFSSGVNGVQAGKRPASSSTPAIVSAAGSNVPILAVGSAGGPRIPTSVAQIVLHCLDSEMNIQQAVSAPRIHHQWVPDQLQVEAQIGPEMRQALAQLGHRVVEGSCRSHGCALRYRPEHDTYTGGADFRSYSASAGF